MRSESERETAEREISDELVFSSASEANLDWSEEGSSERESGAEVERERRGFPSRRVSSERDEKTDRAVITVSKGSQSEL